MHKTDWKEYFIFSKRERVAVVVLLILMLLFFIAPSFYHPFKDQPLAEITTLNEELAKQNTDTTAGLDETVAYAPSGEGEVINNGIAELFAFDPNTLDAAGFKKLGLRDKTIHTIINYRSKGGQFRQPADLRKIYGLNKTDADRLVPYVQIAPHEVSGKREEPLNNIKLKPAVIDINTATPDQWKALPAIGDALAGRIVKFRDKTGGFKSIVQVKQTYGLSEDAFKAIEPYLTINVSHQKTEPSTTKLNINTATLQQLQSNSNIPEVVAKAIVIYRTQHGNYNVVEDIRKIVFINEDMYRQVAPYLSVE